MKNDDPPIEEQIDAIITRLIEGEFDNDDTHRFATVQERRAQYAPQAPHRGRGTAQGTAGVGWVKYLPSRTEDHRVLVREFSQVLQILPQHAIQEKETT